MTRIEHLIQPLYREGKISTAEMIALFGAVHYVKELEDKSQFQSEYGTIGTEGISQLTSQVI